MLTALDPSLSAFILDIKNTDESEKKNKLFNELKIIAANDYDSNKSEYLSIYKKLFLLLNGLDVNEMEFIKAAATNDKDIKQVAYLGLMHNFSQKNLVLLINTMINDLKNPEYRSIVLKSIANFNDPERILSDAVNSIEKMVESDSSFNAYLIVQSKYSDNLPFSLISGNENTLLTKIQIVIDEEKFSYLTENDISYLKSQIFTTKCKFTTVKMLQLFIKLYRLKKIEPTEKLLSHLRNFVISAKQLNKKLMDIAIAIEACNFLAETKNVCSHVEDFILSLLNSDNYNFRFSGFKFVSKYKVLSEIAIDRLIKLGVHHRYHLEVMKRLIDKTNYKIIYKRKEEIVHYTLKNGLDIKTSEKAFLEIIEAIAENADFDFLCKILYNNPKVYGLIRNRNLIIKNQTKGLFKSICNKDEKEYFLMIYDFMPSKSDNSFEISSIAFRHLNILTGGETTEEKLWLLDELLNILCLYGDIEHNRELVVDFYKKSFQLGKSKNLIKKLENMIMMFNLLLDRKCMAYKDGSLVWYELKDKNIEFLCDFDVLSITVSTAGHIKKLIPANGSDSLKFNIEGYKSLRIEIQFVSGVSEKLLTIK